VQVGSAPRRERGASSRLLLGGLGVLVVLAIGGAIWLGASRHAAETLDPAITASLASQGITIGAPSTTSVPTTREQAGAIAFKDFPNHKSVSMVLANVLVRPNAAFNCTCWVVAWQMGSGLPPPGGPPGSKASANQFQSSTRYHVAFIDAQSGKFVFALESYVRSY